MNAPVDPLARNSPLRALSVGAVLLAAVVLACFQVTNLDIGGHLSVGRQVLKTGSIPDTDFFTHTIPGRPYPVHQWLGEVALFGIDHLTGDKGLITLRMLAVLLAGILLYRNARREEAPVVVASGIVLLLLVASRPRFFVRPFLITLVFLPLLQYWISDVRQGRTRRLWPILPLLTIWGHVHSGVLFGILFLAGTLVGEGVKRIGSIASTPGEKRWPGSALDGWNYRRLVLFSVGAAALPFATMAVINPSGLKPLVLPLLFFRDEALRAMINEYRPVDLAVDWPFDLVGGAVLLGILLRPKRVDLTDLLVVVGFGALAFQAVRGILPFAAVAAPMLGRTWGALAEDLFARVGRGPGRPRNRMALANAAEAITILAVIVAALFVSVRASRGWMFPFGFGKDPKHYPERALDFLEAQGVHGPVFNTDIWASCLLWRWHGRRYPVFVDARLEAYPEEFWRDEYYRVLRAAPGWQEVLDRYEVQFAMLRRPGGQADERIGDVLWEDPGWGAVYWDDYVMIFLRRHGRSRRNQEVLRNWEFTSFHPRRPQDVLDLRGENLVRAANELAELVEWTPDSFRTRWALAAAWTRLGEGEAAARLCGALAGHPDARNNPAFARSRAEAELVAGRRDHWEAMLREAGVDPADPRVLFGAASLLSQAAKRDLAVDLYREVLEAAPGDTDAMNNLALLLARRQEGIPEALELIGVAMRRRPDDPYFVATRGEILWRAGERAGAADDFRRALDLLPEEDLAAREEVQRWLSRTE